MPSPVHVASPIVPCEDCFLDLLGASTTPMKCDESASAQHPLLPDLPGEVLNIIYFLTAPTSKSVPLHAIATHKDTAVTFHPRQPALASTCRRLQLDFPLQQYYARNIFKLTRSMLLPGRLEHFFDGRPLARQYMKHVRVEPFAIPWVDPESRKMSDTRPSRITFTIRSSDDGNLRISRLKTRVCCCWVADIAKATSRHSTGDGQVAEFLVRYASKVNSKYAENRQFCPACGMAKTGSHSDDKTARCIVLSFIGMIFLVVAAVMAPRLAQVS